MKQLLVAGIVVLTTLPALAQKGNLSGSFQGNTNFFMRDSSIGAANTPQYDNQLSGSEAWLNLNYSNWGFDFALRFDLYNNSNLPNPLQSYTAQGIGMWSIHTKVEKLDITAGYIYDQIGNGTIFRAFEQRPLAIDNALVGVRLGYDLTEHLKVKTYVGKQKNFFDLYSPTIKAINFDGFYTPSDSSELSIAPGIGVLNRTLDDASMSLIVSNIESQPPSERFVPKYNTYAFTAFNTLNYRNLSWYVEASYKTAEAVNNPLEKKLVHKDGSVLYTSLSYFKETFGVTLYGKRTESFDLRTSPNEALNRGLITFIPPMARENTYRLTARYNAATQFFGELAYMVDLTYSPSRKQSYLLNYSNITDLNGTQLYREIYGEATFKGKKSKWQLTAGAQYQAYNQERYEEKPNVPTVQTIIPFAEFIYKVKSKHSLRLETQYMITEEDYGQWAFLLLEYNISPNWSFSVSDMLNTVPTKGREVKHYPTIFAAYTHGANRFSLSYVKQVEGVVCTGGVCRLEPAFSGVRLTVNSNF